jgi:DNA adenine methylase
MKTCLDRSSPFLKWAGGKTQLLKQFEAFYPESFGGYVEPFLGSGAVFFHVRFLFDPKRILLADQNEELINCYQVVRDEVDGLIKLLRSHRVRHSRKHYYAVRSQGPSELSPVERAARLIYLNKTCYNGLYRVNSGGGFNVPMGSYQNPGIFDEGGLRRASRCLADVRLKTSDFRHCQKFAEPGDFVYIDPPYYPISVTSSFTAYGAKAFDEADQRSLAEVFSELDKKGCLVMLSNSDSPFVRSLYRAYQLNLVRARRSINSVGSKRGGVSEVVVRNYDRRARGKHHA